MGMLPNLGPNMSMAYTKQSGTLSLDMGTARVVFQTATKLATTGVSKIGCRISDGSFVPNPVTNLPASP
jgi:hypothetical protein